MGYRFHTTIRIISFKAYSNSSIFYLNKISGLRMRGVM